MMIRPYRINLGTTSGHLESENFVDCPCKRHHRSTLVFSPLCFASRGSPVRSRPRPPILSDCNALTRFNFAPVSQIWFQLCTNAVIAVRLCTLVPPTERQGPPVLFRWLYGLAFQSFASHLRLHLRIFLEDLRVALSEHLGYPLIRYSSGTQPSGIRGTKVVIPKVRNLCQSKSFPPNSFERRLMPARKQIRPFTRNRHLTFECFNGEGSERNFGDTVRSLRIRHSDHRISKIHLVLTLSESAPCRSATLSL